MPINKTRVIINIPAQIISVEVTFNFSSLSETPFIWVLLPYTISSVKSYAIVNSADEFGDSSYPLSNVGNFSTHFMNTPLGSSILNCTLDLNQTTFQFFPSDETIGIGVNINVKDSLLAIDDSGDGIKTAIYTFYGDNSGVWTDNMSSYMGINTFPTFNEPFTVQIALPYSYYYSSGQPPPIEDYIRGDYRWMMFSMDFLNGHYAQTLVCNFGNPSALAQRELYIFLIGVFSTISITFALEAFTTYIKEKNEKNIDTSSLPFKGAYFE